MDQPSPSNMGILEALAKGKYEEFATAAKPTLNTATSTGSREDRQHS